MLKIISLDTRSILGTSKMVVECSTKISENEILKAKVIQRSHYNAVILITAENLCSHLQRNKDSTMRKLKYEGFSLSL